MKQNQHMPTHLFVAQPGCVECFNLARPVKIKDMSSAFRNRDDSIDPMPAILVFCIFLKILKYVDSFKF